VALLAGCVALPPADLPDPVRSRAPRFTAWSLACERAEERWVLEAEADAWTAGVRLTWTATDAPIEVHLARSVEAAPDGSADRVRLALPIAADPRDAAPGAATRFTCNDDVGAVLELLELDAETASDCVTWGEAPERVAAEAACPGA
jgi:hypothetical protein